MTEPTDAEIWQMWMPMVRRMGVADPVEFARAVLAKWGTPAPVGVEPLSATQVSGLAESAGYWHGDMSRADFINGIRYAEAAHGIKGGQP